MTRDEILLAAAHIFGEKGFDAASMQDIARSVNLQKASLYHHFSSKQEILLALLDRALDTLIERVGQMTAQSLPPEEKIRRAMVVYLQTLEDYRDLSLVLLMQYRSLQPELLRNHIPRRDRFEGLWREMIEQGMEAGIFCCTDPGLVGRALLGVMNGTLTWYRPDGLLTLAEIARQYADLFLDGLISRGEQV